jgi:hypothetical protein
MSKLTQGTQIYAIDPRGSDPVLLIVECATAFSPGGSPKSQIEDTCLDETQAMSYRSGLMAPGQATININADPENESHIDLHEIYSDPLVESIKWVVGWSDGTDAPTIDSSGDFDLPTTRTWFGFEGYIADFPFDFQQNAVVSTAISVQRTGASYWSKKV